MLTACIVWSIMGNSELVHLGTRPLVLTRCGLHRLLWQVYIALRLYGIWDQRKVTLRSITISFIVCYTPVVVFGVIAVKDGISTFEALR